MTRLEKEAARMLEPGYKIEIPPRRFNFGPRPLKSGKGMTKRSYMNPISFGDTEYDAATFEEKIIFL
jgi:hypothetical protein